MDNLKKSRKTTGDLKPLPRTVLPPSEHNGVSVYALSPNGENPG